MLILRLLLWPLFFIGCFTLALILSFIFSVVMVIIGPYKIGVAIEDILSNIGIKNK